jgi:cell division protein FtsW (lipid II flippase)
MSRSRGPTCLRDYQKDRPDAFLNPTPDIQGPGYQLYQSQIAVGSGGLVGKGLTNGTQAQGDFLPVQTTDFVFAVLAEELGFIGRWSVRAVRPAAVASAGGRLALRGPVRDDVLGRAARR